MEITKILLEENLITQEQINDAKDKQLGARKPIYELLIEMGFLKEEDFVRICSERLNLAVFEIDKEKIDPAVFKLIPYEKAKRYGIFPIRVEDSTILIAMGNPFDIIAKDDLEVITHLKVKPLLAAKSLINKCINTYYNSVDELYELVKCAPDSPEKMISGEDSIYGFAINIEELKGDISPVVKLVNFILNDALRNRASDIHIEPQEKFILLRERVDGELKEITTFSIGLLHSLVARIKIMSNLDISETRQPQDGRTKISINDRKIDLRISVVPTIHGEKIVIRVLDLQEAKIELSKIGFEENEFNTFTKAISKPHGMILVTGPTGSGKTSTLYAALNYLKQFKKNVITLEDPVEYTIEGINQMQVNPMKNVTFANGLRSILRQDPDVILIGEIRDKETADMAIQASLTGRLVFSTLHTNSSVSSITRLIDLGLEPYLVASSVILIAAQRLIRLICPHCKEEHSPDKQILDRFHVYIDNLQITKFYKGKGCRKCSYTGYFGRTAIFELLEINDSLREHIIKRSSDDLIIKEAKKSEFKSLAESGMNKVYQGLTTLEELAKVSEVWEIDEELYKIKLPGANLKVLIADDEENILEMLERRLQFSGYDVIRARNGEELIELAIKEHPDIIVSDVTMPKMNGFEATGILKKMLETSLIPIIMLTARQDKESELKGIDIGADDYITKPFDKDKLLARMKMLLRKR